MKINAQNCRSSQYKTYKDMQQTGVLNTQNGCWLKKKKKTGVNTRPTIQVRATSVGEEGKQQQ